MPGGSLWEQVIDDLLLPIDQAIEPGAMRPEQAIKLLDDLIEQLTQRKAAIRDELDDEPGSDDIKVM